jgi:universal stress protein A
MLGYKHVLLATDLSEETEMLAETAAVVAKRMGAKLSIVHVMEHMPVVYGGGEFSIPLDMNLEEHLAKTVRQSLTLIATRIGVPDEDLYISHGSVKGEIMELAIQLEADLIVVGTRGFSGAEFFLGATANAILHTGKCDVLAVRVHQNK